MAGRRRSGMFGCGGAARKQTAGARGEARTSGPTPRKEGGNGDGKGWDPCRQAGSTGRQGAACRCRMRRASGVVWFVLCLRYRPRSDFHAFGLLRPTINHMLVNLVITGSSCSRSCSCLQKCAVCRDVQQRGSMRNAVRCMPVHAQCRRHSQSPQATPLQPASRAHHAQHAQQPTSAAAAPTSTICSSDRKSQKPSIMSTASDVPAITRSRLLSACSSTVGLTTQPRPGIRPTRAPATALRSGMSARGRGRVWREGRCVAFLGGVQPAHWLACPSSRRGPPARPFFRQLLPAAGSRPRAHPPT